MADNIAITPGTGATVGADDIAGVLIQRVKLIHGADGQNDGDVSTGNPLPVSPLDSSLALYSGSVTITSVAGPLPSQACREVYLMNDHESTNDIYIGGPTSQEFRLNPGEKQGVPVGNCSYIYARTISGTAVLRYLARS